MSKKKEPDEMSLKELIEELHGNTLKDGSVTERYWEIYDQLQEKLSVILGLGEDPTEKIDEMEKNIKLLKRHSHKDGKVVVEI